MQCEQHTHQVAITSVACTPLADVMINYLRAHSNCLSSNVYPQELLPLSFSLLPSWRNIDRKTYSTPFIN